MKLTLELLKGPFYAPQMCFSNTARAVRDSRVITALTTVSRVKRRAVPSAFMMPLVKVVTMKILSYVQAAKLSSEHVKFSVLEIVCYFINTSI